MFFTAFFGVLFFSAFADHDLRIPTTSGVMVGKYAEVLNKPLKYFLGVPYAQPPINDLRFKPPVPLYSDEERKTRTFKARCMQPDHFTSVISPLLNPNRGEVSEDCLYLNIYVPDLKSTEVDLPVMIWFPGEGFDFSDPQQYEAEYLSVEGNVIVVTVNYRLSAFGFLSSLTDEAPGNVGLLDQRLAIEWINKNIKNFGGNDKNITVFGRFTGAMSVAIHAFSPLFEKDRLFQRIILQSGIPVGDWAFNRQPLNSTFELAQATNCLFASITDVIACLRQVPADILLKSASKVSTKWRPIFDYKLIYEDTLNSIARKRKIDVDILLGQNIDEGSLCTVALNAVHSPLYTKLVMNKIEQEDFRELIEENLFAFYKYSDSFISKLTVYKYQKGKKSLRENFLQFCGHLLINAHATALADELARKDANIYMYEFNHRASFSVQPSFIRAGHGDDVIFSMGLPLKLKELSTEETHLTKKMVAAITTFARTGSPNWEKYGSEKYINVFGNSEHQTKGLEDAKVFFHSIIPAAQKRCGFEYFSQYPNQLNEPLKFCKNIDLPFFNYFIACIVGIFFLLTILMISCLIKMKTKIAFKRLA